METREFDLNIEKVLENWIRFIANMITFAQQTNIATGTALANLPFLTDDQKTYFKLRTKKLTR